MAWTTPTADNVNARFTDTEREVFSGFNAESLDPLPEVIAQCVSEIRGYVAGCASNVVGPDGMIPERLMGALVSMVRYRLIVRLPTATPAFVEQRRREYEDALSLLDKVAACKFAVDTLNENQTQTESGNTLGRGRSGSDFCKVRFYR